MTTAWAHLPNAKHINRLLESVDANPDLWDAAWHAGPASWSKRSLILTAARYTAWDVSRSSELVVPTAAISDVVWNKNWPTLSAAAPWSRVGTRAVWDAILALIAYDDCAYMIESNVDELKIIAAFGDPRAALLLPACIVFNETKELV